MSLLLDALKKAADDKKASQENGADADQRLDTEPGQDGAIAPPSADRSPKSASDLPSDPLNADSDDLALEPVADDTGTGPADDELELDMHEVDPTHDDLPDYSRDGQRQIMLEAEAVSQHENDDELSLLKVDELDKRPQRVSDEALAMLIYKTNKDIRRQRMAVVGSIAIVSIILLVSGGYYFYTDMQTEIADIEQRHRLTIQAMQAKINREGTPRQSEIVRNLVSDNDLDEKVQFAKTHSAQKAAAKASSKPVKNTAGKEKPVDTEKQPSLVIQKSKKVDPVENSLNQAWQAYSDKHYTTAKKLYRKILSVEPDNRDALLGLGAVAVIENDSSRAYDVYLHLLELDPLDPIATAALSGLRGTNASDETFLLKAAQKNPEAPAINAALGNLYARQDKWKSAQQYYFNAWQKDQDNADYIYNLAVSLDQLDKPKQAIRFYQDSLDRAGNRRVGFSRDVVRKRINKLSGIQ